MNERKVTIFVTVYNIEKHLEHFFAYLKEQTYTDYEVLIIDDGSTDNSRAICEEHAKTDDRIRVISVEHIGISAARNLAFSKITTPYAASLDGDDRFDADYLKHLMDAEEKTGADMVFSNVIYINEDGSERERFSPRKEAFYTQEDFPSLIPALLDENRLNFLYGKLYKTELLRDVRVEEDVKQGSDTMINFMYLKNVRSIAVIEDYDYYYVRYQTRAVTANKGLDCADRLFRINNFARDKAEEYGWMNDEMTRVIDGRFIMSGYFQLKNICGASIPMKQKYIEAERTVNCEEYLSAYRRQEERGNIDSFRFPVVEPGKEKEYVDRTCQVLRDLKRDEQLTRLREKCPESLRKLWRKVRS